jgi:hypothetical protein
MEMTFRRRHLFFRRFALSLAFAAVTASPAAAMRAPADPGLTQVSLSSSGNSLWTDVAYGFGGVAAFAGVAGCASVVLLRSRTGSRFARA